MSFSLRLFGAFEVSPALEPVSRKGQWVLALLALRAGRDVERSWLAGVLWPDTPEAQARYNLRRELTALRRALGDEAERLHASARTVSLDLDGADVDVVAFDAAARAGDALVLDLYRGPLLVDCSAPWAIEEREAFGQRYRGAVARLAASAMERGAPEAAADYLRRAIAVDPLDEGMHRALMRALAAAGSRAAALAAYRALRVQLQRDLQVDPALETRALAEQLRLETPAVGPSRVGALPRPLTPILGREAEIAEVAAAVRVQRLTTLTGSGGVGKSRLAVAAAVGDDVIFLEIGGLADASLVAPALAEALGVKQVPGSSLAELLATSLAGRDLLVVLDDCDRVLAGCAALAEKLLRACPGLRILATSRQSLGVPGEVVWRVPSLSEADAVRLFRDAARCDCDATVAAQICRRLDGIPQAILLAAGRTRAMTPAQILERLDDRFRLLAGGRGGLARHQTLAATLDWSHELLDDAERSALAALSVFAGGCTLADAEAVLGDGALDLLDRLIDRSLVVFDGRYRLLETVRAYAHERLAASGGLDAVRAQHLAHFAALAEAAEPGVFCGAGDPVWLARLDDETENLRAALATALATSPGDAPRIVVPLCWYWFERGRLREATDAVHAVLPLLGSANRRLATRLLAAAGWVTAFDRDHAQALPLFEQSVALAREVGDALELGYALGGSGMARLVLGDLPGARRDLEEAEAVSDGGAVRVLSLLLLAQLLALGGELAPARDRLEEALALARRQGDRNMIGNSLIAVGQFAHATGDPGTAWSSFFEGVELLRAEDCCGRSRLLAALGRLAIDEGQPGLGARLLGAAETLYEQTGVALLVPERPDFAAAQRRARPRLDEVKFALAWNEGRRQGAERALGELQALTAAWSRRVSRS